MEWQCPLPEVRLCSDGICKSACLREVGGLERKESPRASGRIDIDEYWRCTLDSIFMRVCKIASVRMEHLGSQWTDFDKI